MEVFPMMRSPFFSDVVALRDTLDRVVTESLGGPAQPLWSRGNGTNAYAQALPLDVYATEEQAVVLAAAPGMRPQDVEVTVHQNTLTISGSIGSVADTEDAKGATWYVHELGTGTYRRSLTLPFAINADQVDATFEHGMIRIVLPKADQAKPRKIALQTGHDPEAIAASAEERKPAYRGTSRGIWPWARSFDQAHGRGVRGRCVVHLLASTHWLRSHHQEGKYRGRHSSAVSTPACGYAGRVSCLHPAIATRRVSPG